MCAMPQLVRYKTQILSTFYDFTNQIDCDYYEATITHRNANETV